MASLEIKHCPSDIAIIGTGDFARALAKRLAACGMSVIIGSRRPEERKKLPRDDILTKVKLVTIQECFQSSDVVVVALHPEHHVTLAPFANLAAGKVLIDVSNSEKSAAKSNAEKLQAIFTKSFVVKALNTVSSYALESLTITQRSVSVCGDNQDARNIVMQLMSRLGYLGVDAGTLESARRLEAANRSLFPSWGWGGIALGIVWVIWTVYGIMRYYVITGPLAWERFFTDVLSKIFACMSITMLALAYIPGPIAALKQLSSGTKHRRFPKSLENFLMMRKQMGLFALLFGTLHCLMSIAVLNSSYFGSWFQFETVEVSVNATSDTEVEIDSLLSWKGEVSNLFGMLAVAGMAILGITSINSITNSFNWREWQCVHSHFGFVVLLLSVTHVAVHAGPGWKSNPFVETVSKLSFLSLLLPMFALLLKIIILLPCVYIPVQRIRRGWVRGEKVFMMYN